MRSGPASGGGQLLCALSLLAVTGVALLGAAALDGGSSPSATNAEAPPDPQALAELSVKLAPKVARRVERIRGLEFDRRPRPRVVDAEFLNDLGEREARRHGVRRRLIADEAAARLLGMLAPEEELEATVGATGDIAAAAYDTRRDRLYIVRDAVGTSRALLEFVLAHELVHALEDERFRLPDQTVGPSDDGALARLALSEGTATAAMIEYARRHLDPADLADEAPAIDPGSDDFPEFALELFEWAYTGGAGFVDSLYGVTDDWTLVDAAIASRPPASSEQVLHPLAYLRNERPLSVGRPGAALRREGWRPVGTGNLGEIATEQLLRVGGAIIDARRAAAGWGGDRYSVWTRDGKDPRCDADTCRRQVALAMRWRWDSHRDAREFVSAARAYLRDGLGGEASSRATRAGGGEGGGGVWTLDGGAALLKRAGATTTLALAPTAALARAAAR